MFNKPKYFALRQYDVEYDVQYRQLGFWRNDPINLSLEGLVIFFS